MNVPRLQLVPGIVETGVDVEVLELAPASMAEIRAELRRLMHSSQFDASARNRRFLEYVVEETLAGRADRIKAYNIATDVFGRDDSFNPQLDPVVRMEARRLRRSLERFYLTDKIGSSVQINMPKGSYVAKFEFGFTSESYVPKPPANLFAQTSMFRGPSIFISPFQMEGEHQCAASYCDGLLRHIAVGLSRLPEISVYTSVSLPAGDLGSPVATDIDFILTGDTAVVSGKLTATTALVNARNGRVVWGDTFEQSSEVNGILEARDRLAERIVRNLAEQCYAKARARSFAARVEIDR